MFNNKPMLIKANRGAHPCHPFPKSTGRAPRDHGLGFTCVEAMQAKFSFLHGDPMRWYSVWQYLNILSYYHRFPSKVSWKAKTRVLGTVKTPIHFVHLDKTCCSRQLWRKYEHFRITAACWWCYLLYCWQVRKWYIANLLECLLIANQY